MIGSRVAIAVLALSAQGGGTFEEHTSPALQLAGLTTESARFDTGMLTLFSQAEFTTPLFLAATENPWRAPFLFRTMAADVASKAGQPNELVNSGARWIGIGTRRTLIGNPIQKDLDESAKPGAFETVVSTLRATDDQGPIPSAAGVPEPVLRAAAIILNVFEDSYKLNQLSLARIEGRPVAGESWKPFPTAVLADNSPEELARMLRLYRAYEGRYMVAGGHDLLLATQEAVKLVKSVPPDQKYDYFVRTKYGGVFLSGGSNDRRGGRPKSSDPKLTSHLALVIDTGGDDVYEEAPRSGFGAFASVVIDTAGNDKYLSTHNLENASVKDYDLRKRESKSPSDLGPIGAQGGYAILFDLAGNDVYRSHVNGIASALMGVAVLHDAAGDDLYDGYEDSLGFGMFGVGILEDLQGNDTYLGFTQVQGVGQTQGFGALIDRAGNDTYVANDTQIDFPSAQSAEHNTSMSQGAGNGMRRDYIDAHSLAGGVGLLYDAAGDDSYSGAVFAQGVGYWEGVGVLWDEAGNDRYHSLWYGQGASAHFAIGYLEDVAGNDEYVATMNMAQGAGHDFSLGYLLDGGGNDRYTAPNLSLGAGNANGMGVLLESGGDDVYQSSGLMLGKSGDSPAGSLRSRALTLGVFVDLAGSDTYPEAAAWAKNGGSEVNWTAKQTQAQESQLGVFLDRQ